VKYFIKEYIFLDKPLKEIPIVKQEYRLYLLFRDIITLSIKSKILNLSSPYLYTIRGFKFDTFKKLDCLKGKDYKNFIEMLTDKDFILVKGFEFVDSKTLNCFEEFTKNLYKKNNVLDFFVDTAFYKGKLKSLIILKHLPFLYILRKKDSKFSNIFFVVENPSLLVNTLWNYYISKEQKIKEDLKSELRMFFEKYKKIIKI